MGILRFFSNKRVYVATIFLSITLACILIGSFALALFLGVLIFFGSKELVSFTKAKGLNPDFRFIIIINFMLLLAATLYKYVYFSLIMTIAVIGAFILILFRGQKATINDLSATLLGILYGGWLPMHIMLLRNIDSQGFQFLNRNVPDGLGFIVLIFLVITASDIAAYYIGSAYGKTKLWPEVSPKKTVKGAVAATIGGISVSMIFGHFIGLPIHHALVAGFLLSLAAQLGDLCESMLKRDAGFKDSGNVLPGHGGILDRADSYIFTGAVAYYYFSIFVIGNYSLLGILF